MAFSPQSLKILSQSFPKWHCHVCHSNTSQFWHQLVLVRISIATMRHLHDQRASWRGKGLFDVCFRVTIHHQRRSGQKLKTETWRQKLMQKPWIGFAYWLPHFSLPAQLSYRIQTTNPRTAHSQKAETSSINHIFLRKCLAYSPILWSHFLNWGSLLSDDVDLCGWHKTIQHSHSASECTHVKDEKK